MKHLSICVQRVLSSILLVVAAANLSSPAKADMVTDNFTISGGNIAATGTFINTTTATPRRS